MMQYTVSLSYNQVQTQVTTEIQKYMEFLMILLQQASAGYPPVSQYNIICPDNYFDNAHNLMYSHTKYEKYRYDS